MKTFFARSFAQLLLTFFLDRDTVQSLEKKIKTERQTCGERALYLAAMYLWLSGRHDKAREYVERALKMSSYNIEVCLDGVVVQ